MGFIKRHWIIAGLTAAIVVAVGLFGAFSTKGDNKSQYFTSKVEHGDIRQVVEATGTINARLGYRWGDGWRLQLEQDPSITEIFANGAVAAQQLERDCENASSNPSLRSPPRKPPRAVRGSSGTRQRNTVSSIRHNTTWASRDARPPCTACASNLMETSCPANPITPPWATFSPTRGIRSGTTGSPRGCASGRASLPSATGARYFPSVGAAARFNSLR